jgi:hypothetical protein
MTSAISLGDHWQYQPGGSTASNISFHRCYIDERQIFYRQMGDQAGWEAGSVHHRVRNARGSRSESLRRPLLLLVWRFGKLRAANAGNVEYQQS